MIGEALVKLALNTASCTQKELAKRVGVSPGQISKWKNGEYMSLEMEKQFREIALIGEKDPFFVLWSGSLENALKWEKLVGYLAEIASDSSETGYDTNPLLNEEGFLCWETFHTLREMGVTIPAIFPKDLNFDYTDIDEQQHDIITSSPIPALILEIYLALNDVYGFFAAYIAELIDDSSLELEDTTAVNIEPCLMQLAASKLDLSVTEVPGFDQFRYRIQNDYEQWLSIVKERAFKANTPLRAELLDLIYKSHDEVGANAEGESLGFNSSRIHPDIYMNELLVGMRIIHQVLPTILKKLDIDFKLDSAELRVSGSSKSTD